MLATIPRPERAPELDEVTLLRAQRGDDAACRALVSRYERPVFALIGRLVGHGHRALVEDLAQDTFLRTFRALAGFDRAGPAKLSTWILTIATRLAIDELRRVVPPRAPLEAAEAVAVAPRGEAEVERRLLGARLAAALAELPVDQRAVVLLSDVHECSLDEIARGLALELGTVKSRLSRARARLRAALEELHVAQR